jgi:hypothetical protein
MPIGNQVIGDVKISSTDFKKRYDDLIKEAILKTEHDLEVVRADEISLPGTITSDILTRIMHSDYVIADVSYPNPNVFYELGLRHACRTGTIIIKDLDAPMIPFDIAHLRHIEYENSPSGLKQLTTEIDMYFNHFESNPDRPDNHLLELAKLTKYEFLNFNDEPSVEETQVDAMLSVMQNPKMIDLISRKSAGEDVSEAELLSTMMEDPNSASTLLKALVKTGDLSFKSQYH